MADSLNNLTEKQRNIALEKYSILQPHLENNVSLKQLAADSGVAYRTLQEWKELYLKLGLVGLARKIRTDKGTHHVPLELRMIIEGIALTKPRRPPSAIHNTIKPVVEKYDWPLPHERTIRRIINEIEPAMLVLAHDGEKVYNDKYDLLMHRDSGQPNEIWQADHAWLPIWLDNGKGEAAKPLLTVIEDDYSRMIGGYNLSFDHSSSVHTALALRRAILRKTDPRWPLYGYPDIFYSDHGADFKSLHMQQVLLHVKSLHIFSIPGMPRGRGRVERFFRSVEQLLLDELPNYCPNGEAPTAPLWPLNDFEERFQEWLLGKYHLRRHGTTKQTPLSRWESHAFIPRSPESTEDLDLLLLTIEKSRRVQQEGIHFEGRVYIDVLLAAYVGEDVTIRFDPRDLGEVRVYYRDKFLCRAICPELAGETVSLKEIRQARNQRRKQLRQAIQSRSAAAKAALDPHEPEPSKTKKVPKANPNTTSNLKFWRDD